MPFLLVLVLALLCFSSSCTPPAPKTCPDGVPCPTGDCVIDPSGQGYRCVQKCLSNEDCHEGTATTCCDGRCIDTTNDGAHCGSCGSACAEGEACCASACLDVTDDVANCGQCGKSCGGLPHTTASSCFASRCQVVTCAPGFFDCDKEPDNGCEIALEDFGTDPDNCGACGVTCSFNNMAERACVSGACEGTCASGYDDCDQDKLTNGCETSLNSDPDNCGSCGAACTAGNNIGQRACAAGVCSGTCGTGYADCDGDKRVTGCETPLSLLANDPDNCGFCGTVCSSNNIATRTCDNGACNGSCNPGFANCDGNNRTNGCETDIDTDPDNCGGCGVVCSGTNVTARTCTGGVCTSTCSSGFDDCDGDKQSNGCESPVGEFGTDPNKCGGCGKVCATSNLIIRTCSTGACDGVCDFGYADCDGNKQTNGCETLVSSFSTDPDKCGGCGRSCSNNNMASRTCTGGVCDGACVNGFEDCDGDKLVNGCEISLNTNPNHCGACGAACSPNNVVVRTCSQGNCAGICRFGFDSCDGDKRTNGCEVDLRTDPAHCGACGTACSTNHVATPLCSNSQCTGICEEGWADCDGDMRSNGCETNILTDPDHCNGCGLACAGTGSERLCENGICTGGCNPGYADCDNDLRTNGCETPIDSNPINCGGCGKVCSNNHVPSPTCAGGVCNGVCEVGWGDCNNNKLSDGCEIQSAGFDTDVNNCGGCGKVCSNNNMLSRTCSGGVCNGTCADGAADCNNDKLTDGCELTRSPPAYGSIGGTGPGGEVGGSACHVSCATGLSCYNLFGFQVPGGCTKVCRTHADCNPDAGDYCFNYDYWPPNKACAHACINDDDCKVPGVPDALQGMHCISDTRTGSMKRCEANRYPNYGTNGVCPP